MSSDTTIGGPVEGGRLLRFPELSSRHEQRPVHDMTEYFLLGSFVSWLVALGSDVVLV